VDISVILPAFNEEDNINSTILLFVTELRNFSYEIIVVDDGSIDKTELVVVELQRTIPNLVFIKHKSNQGYGSALRSGFNQAKGTWCFFTDSDLQFHPSDFHKLWNSRNKYDVILGYRSPRNDPVFRKINALMWGLYVKHVFGIQVKDLNCAFKLFKTDLLNSIQLNSAGAFINAELLIQFSRKSIHFYEVPVRHFTRKSGVQTGANISVIIAAFMESLRFRYRLR